MIKFTVKLAVSSLSIFLCLAAPAQTPDITVKIIGASYFESPPDRDKNLAIFGTAPSLEKVEVHALAISASRYFAEITPAFEKNDISVTAILPDKTRLPLGSADVGSFPKISKDAKGRTITLKLSRLPDRPIMGLLFEGSLPAQVAKGFLKPSTKFEPRVGATLTLGDIKVSVLKIDEQTVTFTGDDSLARLRSVSIKQADGRVIAAERNGYSRMNSVLTQDWKFSSTPVAGVLEAEVYQAFEVVKLPILIVVGKPY